MTVEEFGKTQAEEVLDTLLNGIEEGVDGDDYGWYQNLFPYIDVEYSYGSPEDSEDGMMEEGTYRGIEHIAAAEAIKYPELHEKMIELVEKVTDINNEYRETWIDDEDHAATHFALQLALYDPKYILLYANFLDSNDLDHEVYQMFDIAAIINKWGWTSETYMLYITRWLAMNGQHPGEEDINEDLTELLDGNEEQKNIFMQAMKKYLVEVCGFNSSDQLEYKVDKFQNFLERYIFPDDKEKQEDMMRRFKAIQI